MKAKLITIAAVSSVLLVSCKKKAPEVKQVEEATAQAVESGSMTKEQAKAINEKMEKAVEMKDEVKELTEKSLAQLDKAVTVDEMRAAVKDATKAGVDVALKAGQVTKEQAELSLKALDNIDLLPEEQLKMMVEQLKTQFRSAQNQVK